MKTERCNELIADFTSNGIPTDSTSKRFPLYLEFQDVIGRSSFSDIFDYYQGLDKAQRGNFLWIACACLDKDTFLEIIRKVVCQNVIIEEEERLFKLFTEKNVDVEERLSYVVSKEEELQAFKNENEYLKKQYSEQHKQVLRMRDRIIPELKIKADKFDQLRSLLA